MEAESVRALQGLRSLRSKMKLAAAEPRKSDYLKNKEKEKWIETSVE